MAYLVFGRNLVFLVSVLVGWLLSGSYVRSQEESSSQCIAYGAPCSSGSEMCCFNPMVTCLTNNREQMSCLSPLDLTNLSPSLASSPFYQGITNATRRLLNLFPGMTSQMGGNMAPPSG